MQILWWGRIGRIAEFIGALAIIAEIIGPERIRGFGKTFRERSLRSVANTNLQDPVGWLKAMAEYYRAPSGSEEERDALKRTEMFETDNLWVVITIGFLIGTPYLAYDLWHSAGVTLLGVIVGIVAATFLGPLVTCGVGIVFRSRGLVFDAAIAAPLARILDRDAVDRWIKLAATVMLVLGFHFDLLAP